MSLIAVYAPALSVDAAVAVLAVLAVMAACTLLGSLVGHRAADAGNDTVVGVGLGGGVLALWGAVGLPVSWGAGALGVVALAGLAAAAARRRMPGGMTWCVLVVLAAFLAIAAGSLATMWDDFFHWLPNAAYVYRYDRLPLPDGPVSLSQWPSYPYTLPFIAAVASWLSGHFLENAGPVANVVFLAGFGAMLVDAVSGGRGRGWALAGMGAVFATVLNPSFNPNIVFATYSDVATAVTTAACAMLGSRLLTRLAEDPAAPLLDLAWRFAFTAVALLNLKQANLVIFVLVLGGLAVTAVHFDGRRLRRLAGTAAVAVIPPLAVFVCWRCHVMRSPTQGEMSFRAPATWNIDVLDRTLSEIGRMMLQNAPFHLLMLGVTVAGVAVVWRANSVGRRLLVTAGVAWIGYNAFLLLVYLGAMTQAEASAAADYWRYSPHIGLLGLTAAVVRLSEWREFARSLPRRAWLAAPALALLLVPLAGGASPWNKAWPVHFRQVGRETAALLPQGSRVALHGGHFADPFGVALRFDLSGQERQGDPDTRARIIWHGEELSQVMEEVRAGRLTHVILTDRVWPMDWAVRDLGVSPLDHETALFAWRGDHWDKLRSWPLPAGL